MCRMKHKEASSGVPRLGFGVTIQDLSSNGVDVMSVRFGVFAL